MCIRDSDDGYPGCDVTAEIFDWGPEVSLISAGWYFDAESERAWVALSSGADACGSAAALASGASTDNLMFVQLLEWSGAGGTFAVSSPLEADGEDGTTDAFVMPYVAELGGLIPLDSGSIVLSGAGAGDVLNVSGLSASNEFGDLADGSFTACWCDALDGIELASAGEGEPPPPPAASLTTPADAWRPLELSLIHISEPTRPY